MRRHAKKVTNKHLPIYAPLLLLLVAPNTLLKFKSGYKTIFIISLSFLLLNLHPITKQSKTKDGEIQYKTRYFLYMKKKNSRLSLHSYIVFWM